MAERTGFSSQQHQQRESANNVIAAAQGLISVINQTLAQGHDGQGRTQQQRVQQPPSTVNQEMSRAFPGLFRQSSGVKRRISNTNKVPKLVKIWKPFDFNLFLLPKQTDMTPSSAEELQYMQAGLGKRSFTMSEDMTHSEFSSLVRKQFPKMDSLSGGWLLHKSTGGNGRRRLTVIPPDSEGYTGSTIRSATGGGKTTLYIMPLQEELDVSPLPFDADEFALMPRERCKKCNEMMPLQILILHVRDCSQASSDEDTRNSSEEEVQIVETLPKKNETEIPKEQCPICHETFPADELEFHASFCGDSPESSPRPNQDPVASGQTLKSEEKFLQWLSCQVDTSKDFHLCVSRTNMFQRGLKLWQRQKNATPESQLKITFLGEAGIDTGALRNEFLTEMIAGIENHLFEGEDGKGKSPKYSLNDLDSGNFKTVGEIFAVSLAQGGPAPGVFQEWCLAFISTGQLDSISRNNVYDPEFSPLIAEVEHASDLAGLTEPILSCGYTGPITLDHKEGIIRAILLHATMRKTPMLREIGEGLKLYNLLMVLQENSAVCTGLFLPGKETKPDANYLMMCLKPEMSPKGSNKEVWETQILNFFQDFLQEIEDDHHEDLPAEDPNASELLNQERLTVPAVMQWLTGQAHKPLLLSEREQFKITVHFDHSCFEHMPWHRVCYPVVSACTKTITFPTAHLKSYDDFKNILREALHCGREFNRV